MLNNTIKNHIGFFISGFFVLSVGAIMPYILEEYRITYTQVGTILSMFAIGNLLSNFIFPWFTLKVPRKLAATIATALIPLGFLLLAVSKNVSYELIGIVFLCMGIGRGSISIISNTLNNDQSKNKAKSMNILHTVWALGAFLSSFVVVGVYNLGIGLQGVLYVLGVIALIMCILYSSIDYPETLPTQEKLKVTTKKLDIFFFLVSFVLFFYVGVENSINGWFMTYLKSMDIIGPNMAAFIVSFMWLMIMLGRLFTAFVASKYITGVKWVLFNTLGVALCFFVLVFAQNPMVITISLFCFGFFVSSIYPTSISNVSSYTLGQEARMALIMVSGAIGGIITPQIIGIIADNTDIQTAINVLGINVILMVIAALGAVWMKHRQKT